MWRKLRTYALWIAVLLLGAAVALAVAIPVLLLRETSALVRAWPPAQAEQAPAEQGSRAPAAPHRSPADPTAHQISASELPRPEAAPAAQPGAPPDPEDAPPAAGEQRIFRSRKALETVDPRELLRQTNVRN